MSVDDNDTRLAAEFAAYRERAVPTYTGVGGPAARATVTKRRHRATAAVVGALVLLVALGVGLFRVDRGEDRLIPATPPPSPAAPTPAPTSYWRPPAGPLDDAKVDFSALPEEDCGGPVVQFREGTASPVYRLDHIFGYDVYNDPLPVRGDVTGDGRPDWVAQLGCLGEGGGVGRSWVLVLTGELPNLTVAGPGIEIGGTDDLRSLERLVVDGESLIVVLRDDQQQETQFRARWTGERLAR